MSSNITDEDKCRLATEVAFDKAMERCGDGDAAKAQFFEMFGELGGDVPDCGPILAEGFTDDVLQSPRKTRQCVVCRAWQLVEEEEKSYTAATKEAWAEAHEAAADSDYEV